MRRNFLVLDEFIKNVVKNDKEMQVIVLEHVSTDAWEDCNYVHLVEEFDGIKNALILPNFVERKQSIEQQ